MKEGEEYNAYITYEAVLDSNFNPVKGRRQKGCDIAFCDKITPAYIEKQRQEFNRQMEALNSLING